MDALNILQCTRQPTTTKNCLAQNVGSAEFKKPWFLEMPLVTKQDTPSLVTFFIFT